MYVEKANKKHDTKRKKQLCTFNPNFAKRQWEQTDCVRHKVDRGKRRSNASCKRNSVRVQKQSKTAEEKVVKHRRWRLWLQKCQ